MFKFNFDVESPEEASKKKNEAVQSADVNEEPDWYDCEQILVDDEKHTSNIGLYKLNSTCMCIQNFKIYSVSYEKQMKCLKDSIKDMKNAETNHSDLMTAVYEGGAKIWECTDDLLNYMINTKLIEDIKDKLVLDLGCGAGLLGILALLCEATVHFQDYNRDVLETITIPNFLINFPSNINERRVLDTKFFSGDWRKFSETTKSCEKFDLILTSETIYNPKNQQKLLDTFAEKLKSDGVVLLAAKTYYFGVGGGIRQFEDLIMSDGRFESKVVWTSEVGICREILEIKFK